MKKINQNILESIVVDFINIIPTLNDRLDTFFIGLVAYYNNNTVTREDVCNFVEKFDTNWNLRNDVWNRTSEESRIIKNKKSNTTSTRKKENWKWYVGGRVSLTLANKNLFKKTGDSITTVDNKNNEVYSISEVFHNNIHTILMEYIETSMFNFNRFDKFKEIEKYRIIEKNEDFVFTTNKYDVVGMTKLQLITVCGERKLTDYINYHRRFEFLKTLNQLNDINIDNNEVYYQKRFNDGIPDFIEMNSNFNRPIEVQYGLLDKRHINNILLKYQIIDNVKETIMIAESFDNVDFSNFNNITFIKIELFKNKENQYVLLFNKIN